MFQALSDPTRLLLLEALRSGEQPVGDLVAKVEIHQSGASRHPHLLGEAGFAQVRPDGPRRLYSQRPEPFRELEEWSSRYRSLWEGRLERLGLSLEHRRQARAAPRKEKT